MQREPQGSGAILAPDDVRRMFDRIVPRYDLMNRLMTGGRDVAWRRKAATIAIANGAPRALDVATGTGDLALELSRQGAELVIGLDFSREMIASAVSKRNTAKQRRVEFLQGDGMSLPLPAGSLDALTIAWGLRNLPDYRRAIREFSRVLAPGGRFVILEMTPLGNPVLRSAFGLYFERVMPVFGGLISGNADAYRYLPSSVNAFPDAETLAGMMRESGLRNVRYLLVGSGTVALHVGIRGGTSSE